MGLKFEIWGFLPVVYSRSSDGWGYAKGIFVKLPEKYDPALLEHEKFHVKQFYAFLAVIILLAVSIPLTQMLIPQMVAGGVWGIFWNTGFARIRKEAAAYGESVRVAVANGHTNPTALIKWYAGILDTAKQYEYEKDTLQEHIDRITRRYKDGRLI